MRCSVSELAPGVNGMTTVIGRDERSSARASSLAVAVMAKTAAKMTAARDMLGLRVLERSGEDLPDALLHLDGAGSINGSRSLTICLTSSASTISSATNP